MNQLDYSTLLQTLWQLKPVDTPDQFVESVEPSGQSPSDITEFLGDQILWQEAFPAQVAEVTPIPKSVPVVLRQALKRQGITQLYSHQLRALKAIRSSKDVILTPPTASGKTLAAYIGILEGCIRHDYRCLAFYGLKALATDQSNKLTALLQAMPEDSLPRFIEMTGDTTSDQRQSLLATDPHLIALTPDLLHYQLRTVWRSQPWQAFLRNLKYVLIDEAHTYSGVYGANMALLLKRLKLAVDRQGGNSNQLQFIFLSATCGNPTQVARQLSGRQPGRKGDCLVWFRKSGAASAEKRLIVTQPSYNTNADTVKMMLYLMQQGITGITFCNGRETTKTLTQLVNQECQIQSYPHLAGKVATFYGSLDNLRCREIMRQLEAGQVQWIIGTEALEAGIDLPVLDCCIIRGFPGSLMSFRQRIGRAGRKNNGLAIYVPIAQSVLDVYYAEREHLLGEVESIGFNDSYPLLLAKHLLCAAAESGIPIDQIKRYFGSASVEVVQRLMEQGILLRGKNGLYAKGFPHAQVAFRGGTLQSSIKLVDITGTSLEEMSEGIAYREVHPGAIYRLQDSNGQLLMYQCQSLDLTTRTATLERIPETSLYTTATESQDISVHQRLTEPAILPLTVPVSQNSTELPHLQLELAWGEISNQVSGYSLMTRLYEHTCLNRRCLKYKEPLPAESVCPYCRKQTRQAEIIKSVSDTQFEQPYSTRLSTMLVKLTIDPTIQEWVKQIAQNLRASFKGQPIPAGYQQLWEHPSSLIALHTLGHQLIMALPLVVRADKREINFLIGKDDGGYHGIFFDQADGGNGASENLVNHFRRVVEVATEIARNQPAGKSDYLYQYGCPDGNKALLNELGLVLLEATIATAPAVD